MALPSPLGLEPLVNRPSWADGAPRSPVPWQQGPKHWLESWLCCARIWALPVIVGPSCRFRSRDGRKFCSVFMDGFEWTLTNKLGPGESLKTNSLKTHPIWDCNAFRTPESYTKPSEITSLEMCSCCICLCVNQLIRFWVRVKIVLHHWGLTYQLQWKILCVGLPLPCTRTQRFLKSEAFHLGRKKQIVNGKEELRDT